MDKAVHLLIHIKGCIGTGHLGHRHFFIIDHTPFKKVLRNPDNVFHIAVKQIFLKDFWGIFHHCHLMKVFQVIFQPFCHRTAIRVHQSDLYTFRLIAAVIFFFAAAWKIAVMPKKIIKYKRIIPLFCFIIFI